MDHSLAADAEAVLDLLRHHAELVQSSIDTVDLPLFDLTMAQLRTLLTVDRHQPATISELARLMGVGLPAASHIVDRLVTIGFIERDEDPSDRRRTLTRLSPAGQRLVDRLKHGPLDAMRAALARLDASTLSALRRGLEAIVAAQRELAEERRRAKDADQPSDVG
jgi:DNA-binding MarR family transcriptional regulator